MIWVPIYLWCSQEFHVELQFGQLFANLDRLFGNEKIIFAGRRTSTPSLKTFDSAFESVSYTYTCVHTCTAAKFQKIRRYLFMPNCLYQITTGCVPVRCTFYTSPLLWSFFIASKSVGRVCLSVVLQLNCAHYISMSSFSSFDCESLNWKFSKNCRC